MVFGLLSWLANLGTQPPHKSHEGRIAASSLQWIPKSAPRLQVHVGHMEKPLRSVHRAAGLEETAPRMSLLSHVSLQAHCPNHGY